LPCTEWEVRLFGTAMTAAFRAEGKTEEEGGSDKPDVILMDVNMPDLDGFATTRRLKADAATKDIPVVFVTGKNQKADIAWGRMLGAKGYVAKPYTSAQILEQLA
jgi:CheY-like chemotaxis protein